MLLNIKTFFVGMGAGGVILDFGFGDAHVTCVILNEVLHQGALRSEGSVCRRGCIGGMYSIGVYASGALNIGT
jgi:hypothetical protein